MKRSIEGSIYQSKDKKTWFARLRYTDIDGRPREKKRVCSTQAIAKNRLRELMMGVLFSILCVLFLLSSCSSPAVRPPETEKENPDIQLTLKRGGCYGTCPIYELTIHSDGHVQFVGFQYTRVIGKAEKTISQQQLKELRAEVAKADFFNLDNSYTEGSNCPSSWTDMSTIILTIQIGENRKTIEHYLGCRQQNFDVIHPPQLYELENRIDQIVQTEEWVKGATN